MATGEPTDYSGKIHLRLGPPLHAETAEAAARAGLSLNTFIVNAIVRELGRLEQANR